MVYIYIFFLGGGLGYNSSTFCLRHHFNDFLCFPFLNLTVGSILLWGAMVRHNHAPVQGCGEVGGLEGGGGCGPGGGQTEVCWKIQIQMQIQIQYRYIDLAAKMVEKHGLA